MNAYAKKIAELVSAHPLGIDTEIVVQGKLPAQASSEFLINKEQGDWAERLVISSINEATDEYVALPYGRADSLAAGDPGFTEFYKHYQQELNTIGKRPDILVFARQDAPADGHVDVEDAQLVTKAVAALEVRSSSFLSEKYNQFMTERNNETLKACQTYVSEVLAPPYGAILKDKNAEIHALLNAATPSTFRELDFRAVSWSSSPELRFISERLRKIREGVRLLHKRDFLSVTPKAEDLALVNRWIQKYGVPHYYLQVFFDKGYLLSFEDILKISSNPAQEGRLFSIEKDVKNQEKTTVKIDIKAAVPLIDEISMPQHTSQLKQLNRGRLLFYVTFAGGHGRVNIKNLKDCLLK